jgi:hypothetical protein
MAQAESASANGEANCRHRREAPRNRHLGVRWSDRKPEPRGWSDGRDSEAGKYRAFAHTRLDLHTKIPVDAPGFCGMILCNGRAIFHEKKAGRRPSEIQTGSRDLWETGEFRGIGNETQEASGDRGFRRIGNEFQAAHGEPQAARGSERNLKGSRRLELRGSSGKPGFRDDPGDRKLSGTASVLTQRRRSRGRKGSAGASSLALSGTGTWNVASREPKPDLRNIGQRGRSPAREIALSLCAADRGRELHLLDGN